MEFVADQFRATPGARAAMFDLPPTDTFEEPSAAGNVVLTQSIGIPIHAISPPSGSTAAAMVLRFLHDSPDTGALVTFVNPGTAKLAWSRTGYARNLHAFTLVLPDGIGMCVAMRLLHGLRASRISFDMTSLAPAVCDYACQAGLSVVLVGGGPGIAERAGARLAEHFPGLRIAGCFDGYGAVDDTIGKIAALEPNIVICGMGAGHQEAFLLRMRGSGWRGWGFTCGGFFDQLQAGLNYYPGWVDRSNLRWAYRLAREPRRLWRRYLLDYVAFWLMLCTAVTVTPRTRGHDA